MFWDNPLTLVPGSPRDLACTNFRDLGQVFKVSETPSSSLW